MLVTASSQLTVHLLLLPLVLASFNESSFNCTPTDYFPPFVDHSSTQSAFDTTSHFLVPQYVFGCEGRIVRWEVHTTGSGPHPIEFSTWQFDSVRGTLMGVNYFPSAAPNQENNILSLAVMPSQQIQVLPGDIVGIRSILARDSNISSPFQMQLVLASDDGVLFYGLEDSRTNVTPQAVEVIPGFNTIPVLRGRPVLRVTVEEGVMSDTDSTTVNTTPSSTASTPETTTTGANEDLVSIIVPVVVCVGVALLLVVALVILVMVCVGVRRRRRKLEKAALHRDSIRLTSNNAYGHREVIMDDVESDVYYSTIQDIQ